MYPTAILKFKLSILQNETISVKAPRSHFQIIIIGVINKIKIPIKKQI
ncbi:hypothetical protein PROSTU_04831 [Providencia stuartii ATCC 25827]|uniref:Uncharacterized protein n=1 Tax=Providencia stuartii ATCC 25827 TaxID=471874 RepID=A0AA87CP46_PROST|nr:hypothetical protein PROSTU_04831 [Providencia stuartii ATCC 25827]